MVILKKIKASTLMETMVATVLIVIIFMVASLILNNTFRNTIVYDTSAVHTHLNRLEYFFHNGQIELPYEERYREWNIRVEKENDSDTATILIEATHISRKKQIQKTILF